ncbi:MAG: type II secretion system protein GspG [Verrucomicrobia bacterium]|nr:type II secretion system protein GspG [Verrucomicrobiota bacterium]
MKHAFPRSGGFTLIELLVVISVITILAGLTLSMLDYANNSAARNRAKAEIGALSLALESYKIDNGDYPRSSSTDTLNARTTTDSTIAGGQYNAASLTLYKQLSGDGADGSTPDRTLSTAEKALGKAYFTFKPNMLYPRVPAGTAATVTALLDPFRNCYGYSTIGSLSTSGTTAATSGYNPTFDLWSTGGTSGTSGTAGWITNWN